MSTHDPIFEHLSSTGFGNRKFAGSRWFNRTYAGYTKPQLRLICDELGRHAARTEIFDPMAGQAFHLSILTWFGKSVRINDLNPAPLLLAWLRSGSTLSELTVLAVDFKNWLGKNKRKLDRHHQSSAGELQYVEDWLSASSAAQIKIFGETAAEASIFSKEDLFAAEPHILFRFAMLALAARRLVCCKPSDNRTWLKPGGLDIQTPLSRILNEELDNLLSSDLVQNYQASFSGKKPGILSISSNAISLESTQKMRTTCIGVTSPPYANRLDYSILWAPELQVIRAALPFIDLDHIKTAQIATNRIRAQELNAEIKKLSYRTRAQLESIKESKSYASGRYYFPYFAQFAVDLHEGLLRSTLAAPRAKTWMIFIRDTLRKDTLFSARDICNHAMAKCGFSEREHTEALHIVKSHVGLVRRANSASSVHGLAQREWWLIYDKT